MLEATTVIDKHGKVAIGLHEIGADFAITIDPKDGPDLAHAVSRLSRLAKRMNDVIRQLGTYGKADVPKASAKPLVDAFAGIGIVLEVRPRELGGLVWLVRPDGGVTP